MILKSEGPRSGLIFRIPIIQIKLTPVGEGWFLSCYYEWRVVFLCELTEVV